MMKALFYVVFIYCVFNQVCSSIRNSELQWKKRVELKAEVTFKAMSLPDTEEQVANEPSKLPNVDAIQSEYLKLYMAPTTLPGLVGHQGVFARYHIPKGEIVCEYRGPIIKRKIAHERKLANNYTWEFTDLDGESSYIMGDSICAYINDCVTILHNPNITRDFLDEWRNEMDTQAAKGEPLASWMPDEIQCSSGRSENIVSLASGYKILYIASRDILPGDEIFVYYGNAYWHSRAASLFEKGHMDICEDCVLWKAPGNRN